jgi:hypothetical protein
VTAVALLASFASLGFSWTGQLGLAGAFAAAALVLAVIGDYHAMREWD